MRKSRFHVAWAVLGAVAAAGLYWAWSLPGALALFAAIGLAFVMWYRVSRRGAWAGFAVMGIAMASVLTVQAVTGSRCPADGTKVFLKENRPPVGCTEIRTSAASMAAFFGIVGLCALAAPLYLRRVEEDEDDDVLQSSAPSA